MSSVTVSEGNVYFATRLYTDPWDEASVQQKEKALSEAQSRVDRLRFQGYKTDATQPYEFPRTNTKFATDEIPVNYKYGILEVAIALLDGVDPAAEYENLAAVAEGYSSVRATYVRSSVPEHQAAGIPSFTAWQYLKPLLCDPRRIRLQ